MDRSEITSDRLRWFAGTSGPYTGRIRPALKMAADKIETLTAEHAGIIEMLGKRVTELSEENERLRAALKIIAGRTEDKLPPFRVMSIDAMARIARDALEQEMRGDSDAKS